MSKQFLVVFVVFCVCYGFNDVMTGVAMWRAPQGPVRIFSHIIHCPAPLTSLSHSDMSRGGQDHRSLIHRTYPQRIVQSILRYYQMLALNCYPTLTWTLPQNLSFCSC